MQCLILCYQELKISLQKKPYTLLLFLLVCFFVTSVYSTVFVTPKMLDNRLRELEIKSTTVNTWQDYQILLSLLYYKKVRKSIYDDKIDQKRTLTRSEEEEYYDLKKEIDRLTIEKDQKFKLIEETMKSPLYPSSYSRGEEDNKNDIIRY